MTYPPQPPGPPQPGPPPQWNQPPGAWRPPTYQGRVPLPYHTPAPLPPPPPPAPKKKSVLVKVLSGLAALGVLGAIGAYYTPGILDRLGGAVTDRIPLDYTIFPADAVSPNYLFPDSVDPGSAPGVPGRSKVDGFAAWAGTHGGVLADEQSIRLVLRGRTSDIVHVNDIQVRVLSRAKPGSGWFNAWTGCGAPVNPNEMTVDVDNGGAVTWVVDEHPTSHPAFTVSSSDEETFDLVVRSTKEEITWVAEVTYSSTERDGVLRIDDHDTPFRLTTIGNAKAYELDAAGVRWVRAPDRDPGQPGMDRPTC